MWVLQWLTAHWLIITTVSTSLAGAFWRWRRRVGRSWPLRVARSIGTILSANILLQTALLQAEANKARIEALEAQIHMLESNRSISAGGTGSGSGSPGTIPMASRRKRTRPMPSSPNADEPTPPTN